MFHNVLSVSCFTSGSQCHMMYHNVLQVFHDVLLCLNNVLQCLVSQAMIGIADHTAANRLRDRDNAAGIGDNSSGLVDIAMKVIPC